MKNIKIDLRLTDEQKRQLPRKLLKSKRLIFIVCVGLFSVYAFNIVYRKAYVEIKYVEYEAGTGLASTRQEGVALERIMQKMDAKKANLEQAREKEYKDPFEYQADPAENVASDIDDGTVDNASKMTPTGR